VKIKDIIAEGLYDYLTQIGQQGKQAAWAKSGSSKFYADQRAKQQQAWNQSQIPSNSDAELLTMWNEWMQYPEFQNGTQGPSDYADKVEAEISRLVQEAAIFEPVKYSRNYRLTQI